MSGVKGQKNPSKHKRLNRYSAGTVQPIRDPQTIAFRPLRGLSERIQADISSRGITKQAWCDEAVNLMLNQDHNLLSPLVLDAINLAIVQKEAAVAREKKQKHSDQALIEKWTKEVEQLKSILVSVS
ncbi:MAG: hypothetical protein F6K58_25990 [Symploca sp. SIO2E9]|nr:hypothetical protein [Symploca sp. SIO2E9]